MSKIKKLTLILSTLLALNIATVNAETLHIDNNSTVSEQTPENEYKIVSKDLLPYDISENTSDITFDDNNLITSKAIIGDTDNRYRITSTTSYPYSAIASLEITFPNGHKTTGTGFMIGSNTVATAGHCVYDKAKGGFAKSIKVIPGRNGTSSAPFGTAYASSVHSVEQWTVNSNTNYDLGVIKLNTSIGSKTGTFKLPTSTSSIRNLNVSIAGYPVDKTAYTLWKHNGVVSSDTGYKVRYPIDTYGGQSGAPVYSGNSSSGYTVHAIHASGSSTSNAGTKLNSAALTFLKSFINN